jgi:predicted nucleic acid-binding protein
VKPVFADTSFFLSLLNEQDESHAAAVEWHQRARTSIVTTQWVLVETLNAMAAKRDRAGAAELVRRLMADGGVDVVDDEGLFEAGLRLYRERPDKEWSVTDCISFLVMKRRRLSDALTGDHHFAQAGFKVLFK